MIKKEGAKLGFEPTTPKGGLIRCFPTLLWVSGDKTSPGFLNPSAAEFPFGKLSRFVLVVIGFFTCGVSISVFASLSEKTPKLKNFLLFLFQLERFDCTIISNDQRASGPNLTMPQVPAFSTF